MIVRPRDHDFTLIEDSSWFSVAGISDHRFGALRMSQSFDNFIVGEPG